MIKRGLFFGEAFFVASKEGRVGVFNVGLCVVLDLRKAPKGEEVTVCVALYSISNSFSFSGISKWYLRVRA